MLGLKCIIFLRFYLFILERDKEHEQGFGEEERQRKKEKENTSRLHAEHGD